jgi:hypothetical protein
MEPRFIDTISHEISKEKAESLGRAGRVLEQALRELRDFDARRDLPATVREEQRHRLLGRLARLVMNVVVQREACGLIDADYVLAFYKVPPDVVALLGKRSPPHLEPNQIGVPTRGIPPAGNRG